MKKDRVWTIIVVLTCLIIAMGTSLLLLACAFTKPPEELKKNKETQVVTKVVKEDPKPPICICNLTVNNPSPVKQHRSTKKVTYRIKSNPCKGK